MLTRRRFLVVGGATLAAFSLPSHGTDAVPEALDHILLGCSELEQGIALVEERTGVRAAFGGVHPNRGTQNALLSLGERHYLEIIAPDPKQQTTEASSMANTTATSLLARVKSLKTPRLVGWAAHPGDLTAYSKKLRDAGIAFTGPTPGSRKRPDGRVLQWQTLNLQDDHSRLLPFFIEWSTDSPHPADDAPKGCRLTRFELAVPDPDTFRKLLVLMSLELPLTKDLRSQIRATLVGPQGQLDLTSCVLSSL